ncbi:alpha-glucosidase/alpha-galactosidase [Marivivens marinus]|uniref:alpha-glucosidase/alpha-galactosidase n=1 Tax=Marivivens marinus TaxID=3110173 RepID=UPI003B846084
MSGPKIAFIGAGSTVFMTNIIGDVLQREALKGAHVALMDINQTRLKESEIVFEKLVMSLDVPATHSLHTNQREALEGADFVVVAFQIGGFEPCTVTDFEIPKKFGLRQTIADTLGIGGIMRGLRTVPHLWSICEDMMAVCPDALLLQYVNPMAINTWAIAAKYPKIKQVGLCHSVQHTAAELASDLKLPVEKIRYRSAGINHVAYFLEFAEIMEDGTYRDLYPQLQQGYANGTFPRPESSWNPRCPNKVRYEMMKRLGYFATESSEHFAEYVPWFIKKGREDIIERFGIPLDEYPKRCVEQIASWQDRLEEFKNSEKIDVPNSVEYASEIMNSVWTGTPSVIYGNIANAGYIPDLPEGCAVEVPCLVDRNGIQPTRVADLPPQLTAIMRSNINVQELTVKALLTENREHIYHAAMMDPHTGAELDLDQIWSLVDALIEAHGDWLPSWLSGARTMRVA